MTEKDKVSQEKQASRSAQREYLERYNFPFCPEITKYEKIAKIGQGSFGEVFKARESATPTSEKYVALKRILSNENLYGFPPTALREVRILQMLKHEHVVGFIETCRTNPSATNLYRPSFYLVLEYCEYDLAGLLSNLHVKFTLSEMKNIVEQILIGLQYVHEKRVIHRDLKAANILVNKAGVLKLADFGLSRPFFLPRLGKPNHFSHKVVTLWYRPPELLLGATNYGTSVDLWSVGHIMAELWTRDPLLQGATEQRQLSLIYRLCGTATPENWPGVETLPFYVATRKIRTYKRKLIHRLKPYAVDRLSFLLIDNFLTLDPSKRYDCETALKHEFFTTDPKPTTLLRVLEVHKTNDVLIKEETPQIIRYLSGAYDFLLQ